MTALLLALAAYLLGSISSAVVVARVMGLADPREAGSRNPGATNILRIGGKGAAAVTLAGDMLKGLAPVAIVRAFTQDPVVWSLVAAAAFLGHLYPVFFRFRGGKGVATALGVYLGLAPAVGAALIATWLITAALLRYSSVAALTAAALAPFYVWWLVPQRPVLVLAVAVSALLFWRHRSNIRNLAAGTEDKIGTRRAGG